MIHTFTCSQVEYQLCHYCGVPMETGIPGVTVPAATYRLQFNKDFTFQAAANLIPYLADLGISHVYASPYLKARGGSLHGYDIIDHNSLNPEVGTDEDFARFVETLAKHGMHQVLDIVPNHMCVESSDNLWWQDVLENGVASSRAGYFDINWSPIKRELTNKVLLPVLGAQFGKILENRELSLAYQEGSFNVWYYEQRFPLSPESIAQILSLRLDELELNLAEEDREAFEDLHSIIGAFERLPSGNEPDETALIERTREKDVTKRRLWKLYNDSRPIREFIDRTVDTFNGEPGNPASFAPMERLLLQQSFRIAHWRVATEEINYRRFFDINALGAIRIELAPVFDEVHRFVLDLIGSGRLAGFRIDHADGLYNPVKYFHQLQYACFQKLWNPGHLQQEGTPDADVSRERMTQTYQQLLDADPEFKPFYVLGEKILLQKEDIPRDWTIHGETGYSFINTLNHLFLKQENSGTFDTFYRTFTGTQDSFRSLLYQKKKLVMYSSMSSELNTLGHRLSGLAETNRHTRDFTLYSLIKALVEVIAYFPVYRTYTNSLQVGEADQEQINHAVDRAQKKARGMDPSVFDFVRDVLTLRFYDDMTDENKFQWLDFVMRFQQITGPVMAKGMEDTTFYVYNRFISLNEVGGDPESFGMSIAEFHSLNLERLKSVPHGMLASSTHDTKRSEDVRARISLLSELPDEWVGAVSRWNRNNHRHKKLVEDEIVPNTNKEYHLYQTLVGAWPVNSDDPAVFAGFTGRIQEYMLKALREAKEHTSWINPNVPYEQGVAAFIDAILSDRTFRDDMKLFLVPLAKAGMYSSLSMTLLKLTCPGVPDFYQGSELWDLRLVDPDNRQPVDYERRARFLDQLKRMEDEAGRKAVAEALLEKMEDGRVKLFLIRQVLRFRREYASLFRDGEYLPLEVHGKADHVCAFSRSSGDDEAVVVAPRFFMELTGNGRRKPCGSETWENAFLSLPSSSGKYRNILTGDCYEVTKGGLPLGDVLQVFPVALLAKEA